MLDPINPVLPILIVAIEDKNQKPQPKKLPEMRHWQIEEFLRQTGKALNTLRSFYNWLRKSNGYPLNQPLPTDAIDLEREPELPAAHLDGEELEAIQQALELPSLTQVRDRAIVAVLGHGLRASEVSALNVEHWNGKVLTVHRSKGQNVSEVPLSREARSHLQAYLDWRQVRGRLFELKPQDALFLA